MMQIIKSKVLVSVMAIMMAVSLLPAFTSTSYAEPVSEALDFVNDQESRSGDGWNWDKESLTLTLSDIDLDLSGYTDDYQAAVYLPDNSNISVTGNSNSISVSGVQQSGEYRTAILSDGMITINGDSLLTITAEDGANGIEADGDLLIGNSEEGTGLSINVTASEFAFAAKGVMYVSNTTIEGITSTGDYGPILVQNDGRESEAFYADNSDITVQAGGSGETEEENETEEVEGAHGIWAYYGNIDICNSSYSQTYSEGGKNTDGIAASNGSVIIDTSVVYGDLSVDEGPGGVFLSAGFADNTYETDRNIIIKDSEVNVSAKSEAINVGNPFGSLEIDNSAVVLNTAFESITVGTSDFSAGISISNSDFSVTNTGYGYSVRSMGPVSISDSNVEITASGESGTALIVNKCNHLTLSGEVTYVKFDGTKAALELNGDTEKYTDVPLVLNDGIEAVSGGTLQHVDYILGGDTDKTTSYSYSEGTLEFDPDKACLANASTEVEFAVPQEEPSITKQPEDMTVSWPKGAGFDVEVNAPDMIESYQWYAYDGSNTFKLDGITATENSLVIPSTYQKDPDLEFYCEITTKDGNVLTSDRAVLSKDNNEEDKTVLYVQNYAVEPGGSLDLSSTSLGSGTISFDEDGSTVYFENVQFDNTEAVFDHTISPAIGIMLYRENNEIDSYDIGLTGDNIIKNTYYQEASNGCGITLDFMFSGSEGILPDIGIEGEGTLTIEGGTNGIRAIGNLHLLAHVTTVPNGDIFSDAIRSHDLTVYPGAVLDLTANGSGLSTEGTLTLKSDSVVNINTTAPLVPGTPTSKAGIFSYGDLVLEPDSELHIIGAADPERFVPAGSYIESFGGIYLSNGGSLNANGALIDITLSAEESDTEYAYSFSGINGFDGSDINLKETGLSVQIEGKDIKGAMGIHTQGNVSVSDGSDVSAVIKTDSSVYGLAPEGKLEVTDSDINCDTESLSGDLCIGIAAEGIDVNIEDPEFTIEITAKDGIAIAAETGKTGDSPVGYDAAYKAKNTKLDGYASIIDPENSAISTSSIPGSMSKYIYLETVYNKDDTSKPADHVIISSKPVDIAKQPASASALYPYEVEFSVEAADPENIESYQWEIYDGVRTYVLECDSAKTDTLKLPSTSQFVGDTAKYRCLLKGKDGSASYSDYADLTIQNKNIDKTVLYVGNYYLEPGDTMDLDKLGLGSGKISFDMEGKDITFDNVIFDNSDPVYDYFDSEAIGIELYRNNNDVEQYTIHLIGENNIKNTFYQKDYDLSGIDLDIRMTGENSVIPTVVIEGDSLSATGGTYMIHSVGNVEVSADLTYEPEGTHEGNGFYIQSGDLIVTDGSLLDMKVNGAVAEVDGDFIIEKGSGITAVCDIPVPFESDEGYNPISRHIIYVGGNIIADTAQINLKIAPDMDKVNSRQTFIEGLCGICSLTGNVTFENSRANVNLVPKGLEGSIINFVGITADAGTVNSVASTLIVTTPALSPVICQGIGGQEGIMISGDSAVSVNVSSDQNTMGIFSGNSVEIYDSNVSSKVSSTQNSTEIAIAGGIGKVIVEMTDETHKVIGSTSDGIAFCALIDSSDTPVKYTEGYASKYIRYDELAVCVSPEENEINLYAIPVSEYVSEDGTETVIYNNVEAVYDSADTSKPANAVTVTGEYIAVEGVKLDKNTAELTEGDTLQLKAEITPDNATNKKLTWKTDNSGTVSVTEEGLVTADKAGTATVTVTTEDGGFTDKCNITVKAKVLKPEEIKLNNTSAEMKTSKTNAGDSTLKLTATVLPAAASNKNVTWSTSDEKIATVDSDGKVTALRYGNVVITATSEADPSITASCTIQTRYYDVLGSSVKGQTDYKYFFAPVYWAADKEITKGYDNVFFGPDQNCLREQMITFLWREEGNPEPSVKTSPFSDVNNPNSYYYKAVLWAYEKGITKGYITGPKKGTFGVGEKVKRQDTVTFLYRLAGAPAVSSADLVKYTFPDVSKNAYYRKAIAWAAKNGITYGYSTGPYKGKFGVGLDVLRKDIVTFLYRYVNNVK